MSDYTDVAPLLQLFFRVSASKGPAVAQQNVVAYPSGSSRELPAGVLAEP